ncbi:MAG: terminase large subunit domain-containing protein [Syntrophothermus sp.]
MNHFNFSKNKQAKQSRAHLNGSSTESHTVVKHVEIPCAKEWEKQIWYYRKHLDVFIEEYLSTEDKPIRLFLFQKVLARAVGNMEWIDDVESRSLGKTWKMALILISLCILYPGTTVLVVSKTVRQAILTVKYIEQLCSDNPNIAREIILPVRIQKDFGRVLFKSGSSIEAMAMNVDGSNIRGLRKKVIYIDESAWVATDVIHSVLMPILQYKRNVYWKHKDSGFEDYKSKLIQTSSAYLKSCDFFPRFKKTLTDMKNGDTTKFACALSYMTGVRTGIIDENFVEAQKALMPLTSWEMEWNAKFIGSTEGSYFPYEITEPCRVLTSVEMVQPKRSKSRYILSCDIATSASTYADNACICVIKMSERTNGTFNKYLVCIQTYHGYQLESLANEVRKFCIRFPNVEKVIIDINALGEGIISLLNAPFTDDGKEYPPFVLDTERNYGNTVPIIRGIRADNKFNARMATATRMFLENKSIELPVPSTSMRREIEIVDDNDTKMKRNLLMEETAIFVETDALQYEMGNIIPKITVAGNVQYDTQSNYLHKDRYTSLAMGLEYIYQLEQENKDKNRKTTDFCIGAAYNW